MNSDPHPIYRKISWHLLPLLFCCYVIAYIDRVNVGFAKLEMLTDLSMSEAAYGLGAGMFFIGYFLLEVPSNLILHRVGARLWIGRIMITWGILSGAMAHVTTEYQFYVVRLLLGMAEAGFFPGILLYLGYWYPAGVRTRVTAIFMAAVPVAGMIGGPLSGWIMQFLEGHGGQRGWQWMYWIEAVPAVLLGIYVAARLPDNPRHARWLSHAQRELVATSIATEETTKTHGSFRDALGTPRFWQLCAVYFCLVMGNYGVSFWLPSVIKGTGVTDPSQVGLLSALPWIAALVAMMAASASADRHREYRWHVAMPSLLSALGFYLTASHLHGTAGALVAMTLAACGIITSLPIFWSLPATTLSGVAAAGGIALINSLGNVAGFLSPYLVGWLNDRTGSAVAGLHAIAAFLVLGALLTLTLKSPKTN
ncbi:MAG: MFS transporter [Deltaproteobacteria bacterium]|nr:MFS transporter [Deltaproteobacteria bacterium]